MKRIFFTLVTLMISSTLFAQLMAKRQPATQDAVMMLELTTQGNLEEILWYISAPIEIQREVEITKDLDVQALMATGKLKIVGGKYFELDKFTNNATGLIEYKKDDIIAIRFGNDEGRFLEFKLNELSGLETVQYYKLLVKDREEGKLSGGSVHYAGSDWDLISGSRVTLEFKAKGNTGSKVQKTKVKGLRKDGTERKGLQLPKKKH